MRSPGTHGRHVHRAPRGLAPLARAHGAERRTAGHLLRRAEALNSNVHYTQARLGVSKQETTGDRSGQNPSEFWGFKRSGPQNSRSMRTVSGADPADLLRLPSTTVG